MGLTMPEFVIARQVMLSNGVPPTAIQMIGTNVTSTRDEAVAVRSGHLALDDSFPRDQSPSLQRRFRGRLAHRGAAVGHRRRLAT